MTSFGLGVHVVMLIPVSFVISKSLVGCISKYERESCCILSQSFILVVPSPCSFMSLRLKLMEFIKTPTFPCVSVLKSFWTTGGPEVHQALC